MRHYTFSLVFLLFTCFTARSQWQDSLSHQGVVSTWGGYNANIDKPLWLGGRYIPQLNYKVKDSDNRLVDFEASANVSLSAEIYPFDTISGEVNLRAYRIWARYSGRQYEVRLGLQKINFGSATLLRPLMWFDQLDPRDPLQLTNGVWGLLGRYYFLNNTNIWLWGLWGNKGPKTWETGKTSQSYPEMGGRIQWPVLNGEAAFSYHFRQAKPLLPSSDVPDYDHTPEHRFGFDGKWNAGVGFWLEATWLHKNRNRELLTDQEMISLGTDYTFALGNGLYTVLEHLLYSVDPSPFACDNIYSFSALSLSYPIGLNDHISAIFYHDWKNRNQYNFINWQHQFSQLSFYLMGFLNPKNYYLPQQGNASRLFAGKGFQVMFVYNY